MHIRPVTQKDLYGFAQVIGLSSWDDEVVCYIAPYRDQYPDSYFRYCLHRSRRRWYRGEFMFVCVSDENDRDWTGKEVIMGGCAYSTTVKTAEKPAPQGWLGNTFEQRALGVFDHYSRLFKLDKSADQEAERNFHLAVANDIFEPYFSSLPAERKEAMQEQHWELESLGTHPDFRRRGVGKMLLQWGFKQATKDEVPLLVSSSIIGEKLYLNTGFREVNRFNMLSDGRFSDARLKELDFGLGKGKGLSWAAMVWDPLSPS